MDNWIKGMRVIICLILLAALCACSTGVQTASQDEIEQMNQQISALEAQIVVLEEQLAQTPGGEDYEGEGQSDFIDVESLLHRISSSDEALTSFPVLITGGSVSEEGCTLKFDRLEYNPDFTPGGTSDEEYLLNTEEIEEEIDASWAYAQYDGRVTDEIGEDFMDYVASMGMNVPFTLYMLGDELVLASEILVP